MHERWAMKELISKMSAGKRTSLNLSQEKAYIFYEFFMQKSEVSGLVERG